MKPTVQRAPFSSDLQELRGFLPEILKILQADSEWYASLYFERKSGVTASANLKQTQVSERVSSGLVMRIYDGYTLHETATDDLRESSVRLLAESFVARLRSDQVRAGKEFRPYRAPSWSDRLKAPLEEEILSQIPSSVNAQTAVHFGVRFEEDPRVGSVEPLMEEVKKLIHRAQFVTNTLGIAPEKITYLSARRSFYQEEAIFVDAQSNLSQTLYRNSVFVAAMSGADRTYFTTGGLGGLECVEVSDQDLKSVLMDLMAILEAQRLEPGRYRVIFGPVVSGVLAHEAFGHSQEGDTCARGRSKAWELYLSGQSVGNEQATILNNPAVYQNGEFSYAAWGSYFFDEEGWLAREQVLLQEGKLQAPMTNLTSALRLGVPRTANGKRESWASGVYTRQTNTYFSAGKKTLNELMEELGEGFIATHPAGGMEDPKGMGIQVGIAYLKEVKDGKLTGRVFKGPAGGDIQMTGFVPDVLSRIVAKSKIEVGHSSEDRARFPFNDNGGCGKYHKEYVHAGCGGPYMLLDGVTLG